MEPNNAPWLVIGSDPAHYSVTVHYGEAAARTQALHAARHDALAVPLNVAREAPAMMEAFRQIERLSRTADRANVDVPAMLGDIARSILARIDYAVPK